MIKLKNIIEIHFVSQFINENLIFVVIINKNKLFIIKYLKLS